MDRGFNYLIVPYTRSRWVLTSSTSHWAQRRIFRYLSSIFNAQLLHNMAFNSYATIEARISEACDANREYIDKLDKINMCARPQMIVGAANYLIRFENRVVGHHQWLKRFLERNPEYHIWKQNL